FERVLGSKLDQKTGRWLQRLRLFISPELRHDKAHRKDMQTFFFERAVALVVQIDLFRFDVWYEKEHEVETISWIKRVVACGILGAVLVFASESNPQIYTSRPNAVCCFSNLLQQSSPAQKRMDGIWVGVLEVQGIKLRLILRIAQDSGGTLTAKLDVPDQGASNLPIDSISLKGQSL